MPAVSLQQTCEWTSAHTLRAQQLLLQFILECVVELPRMGMSHEDLLVDGVRAMGVIRKRARADGGTSRGFLKSIEWDFLGFDMMASQGRVEIFIEGFVIAVWRHAPSIGLEKP